MTTVDFRLVEIALTQVSGIEFEKFFHAFYSAVTGIEFVPLGGVRDGGADAFLADRISKSNSRGPGTFYQASIETDYRSKIRRTVKRLREVGRNPVTLNYFTSCNVPRIDMVEEKLSSELDIEIRIRDRAWIVNNINSSAQTVEAYKTYLYPNITFLEEIGGNTLIRNPPGNTARTMCVFLGQEIERRRGNTSLLKAVTDSLILWALEGTDPDSGNFMTRDDILQKIENALPSAKQFIRQNFDYQVEHLASKKNESGREVKWYRKEDKFCLPYETRLIVAEENTDDEFLKLSVMRVYEQRAEDLLDDSESITPDQIARIAHQTLELTFEKEGLVLSEFLTGDSQAEQPSTISDQVDKALTNANLSGKSRIRMKEIVLIVLRNAFYNSTEVERVYYGKLSRTYTLLFTLRNEPKIVEYFQRMSADFKLFVGSDIIIRVLSERYLAAEDQMTVNMLRIVRDAGSELYLTQAVVEEVRWHLKTTDFEFQNYFAEMEPHIDKEFVRHVNKILIRAYFYAKLDPLVNEAPEGWKAFIEQVCNYRDLHVDQKAQRQITQYLVAKFDFRYLDNDELDKITNSDEVDKLTSEISEIKSTEILAYNDARQILAVYGKRKFLNEEHLSNPYGYRVWWLTHETRIRNKTAELEQKKGSPYIMRPEFILNFIALSPNMAEVQESYKTVFPSLLGVKLANRMRDDVFHDVMEKTKEYRKYDDARINVMMSEMSNKLKGDNYKEYEANFDHRNM